MSGWIYIMASRRNGTIYTGVTSDLQGRAFDHRTSAMAGFTSKYGCKILVWYERHDNIVEAIAREKQLKKWRRAWKLYLIEGFNPEWDDLMRLATKETIRRTQSERDKQSKSALWIPGSATRPRNDGRMR